MISITYNHRRSEYKGQSARKLTPDRVLDVQLSQSIHMRIVYLIKIKNMKYKILLNQ